MIYAFDVKMKDNYILFCKSKLYKDLFLLTFYACDNAVRLNWTVLACEGFIHTLSGSVWFSLH